MKTTRKHRPLRFWAVLALAAGALASSAAAQTAEEGKTEATGGGKAWIIPVRGDIEPSLEAFIRRESRRALAQGAAFLVYEIDTFGGRVDTALQISSYIGSVKSARTIAWVRSGPESLGVSWSAGALIALSCTDIYMAAGTSIGAAAPVTVGADGKMEATGEKTVSAVRSQMAALAEKNGHPAGIALAMVDQDVELWEIEVDGSPRVATLAELERLEREKPAGVKRLSVISPAGKLLSLTAGEAVKYGLARGTADEAPALLAAIGADPESVASVPGVADQVVSLLVSGPVQAILILLGLVMLFLEINSPGFGVPGAVAVIAFLCVFGANALLGTVGSLELILFLAGVGLLAVEIFVLPGFGVTGIAGFLLIALSLLFSRQDFIVPTQSWQWDLLGRNAVVVAAGIVAAIFGIAAVILAGPRLRLFDRLTLNTKILGTAGGPDPGVPARVVPLESAAEDYTALVGSKGRALTTLRPSGKGEFEGRPYVVEADGEFLDSGTPIEVMRVRGNTIFVRSV